MLGHGGVRSGFLFDALPVTDSAPVRKPRLFLIPSIARKAVLAMTEAEKQVRFGYAQEFPSARNANRSEPFGTGYGVRMIFDFVIYSR
jgi:hypothetical protein